LHKRYISVENISLKLSLLFPRSCATFISIVTLDNSPFQSAAEKATIIRIMAMESTTIGVIRAARCLEMLLINRLLPLASGTSLLSVDTSEHCQVSGYLI